MHATDDRFREVDAVLDQVLDLPEAEQAGFVEHACAHDPALRAEVLSLLAAHHRAGGILDVPVARVGGLLGTAPSAPSVPARIGPFRVVRAVGEGGMGQVFLGEREAGDFEQRVAIKLMRHPSPGLVRRFLEERRILARLEHPNIARLVDGGLTDDGLPYFAMEYVEGEPIDRYCETRALPLEARLALVERVCSAVSYAHQHLVIHRDLKPANILVTADGVVKLLDFGIAKLLENPDGTPRPGETGSGMRVMTPEVAAPEQVEGGPLSTATDVYALGVLLYQLIAGRRPYELRDRSLAEMARLVCETDPPPPSTHVAPTLRRRVRGDLDLVVMTALRKDPARRYESPAALADELQRVRLRQPIRARRDSLVYRARRFAARHRAAVAAAVMLVAALAVGATRERLLRNRAEQEARKAREVEDFLVGVFEVADPFAWSESDRGTMRARDLLDRGAARIDSTLGTQPEVQAELRAVLGRVYGSLGLVGQAQPLLERSLAQRLALHGPDDTTVATTRDQLGMVLLRQDRLDDAETLLRAGLDARRRRLGEQHPATARSMAHLATLLEERARFPEAQRLREQVLAIHTANAGPDDPETANALNDLGLVRYRRGDVAPAESAYRRALDIQLRRLGERHARTAVTMQNLAQTLERRGELEEAERFFRRSLAAKRAVLGDLHPSVTIGLNNLAYFLATRRDRLDEGEALVREAMALDTRLFGPRHSYVAEGLRNLGMILRTRGRFVQAESAFRAAIDIDRGLPGDHREKLASLLNHLAQVRYMLGDSAGSIRLTRESLEHYEASLGPDHVYTAIIRGNLARGLTESGDAVQGEALARAALVRLDSTPKGGSRSSYIAVLRALGAAVAAQGRTGEARPMLERALAMSRADFGEENFRTAHAKLSLAQALAREGRRADAVALLREAQRALASQRETQPRLARQVDDALARLRGAG